jgi:hypothetical protein
VVLTFCRRGLTVFIFKHVLMRVIIYLIIILSKIDFQSLSPLTGLSNIGLIYNSFNNYFWYFDAFKL